MSVPVDERGGPRRVLHADDDPELLRMSDELLCGADDRTEVLTATTGTAVLETLATERVDCVVTDSMTTAAGETVAGAVRRRHPAVAVVVFSAEADAASADVADAVVRKGEGFEALLAAVREATHGTGTGGDGHPVDAVAGDWEPLARHRWGRDGELVATVARAVSSHLDRPVDAMPPLNEAVDVGAMEVLLRPASVGRRREDVSVTFEYCGVDFAVTGAGLVAVSTDR
jgi:CheY-like chemotaxis protein